MQRSGSTLQYQLACAIVEHQQQGKRLGSVNTSEFSQVYADHNQDGGFLVIKSHDYLPEAEALVQQGCAKVIYCYRDFRDVVVSHINKYQRTVDEVLQSTYIED